MLNYKRSSSMPSIPKLTLIKELIDPLAFTDVLSTTMDSCVIITESAMYALLASDILLDHGIISKTIRGHFIDCYYLTIRYDN